MIPDSRTLLLILFSVSASAQTVETECVTKCGLRIKATEDCVGLQEMETRTLRAFAQHVDGWDYINTCQALEGWKVFIHKRTYEDRKECPTGGFWYPNDEKDCFAGFTHHYTREVELDNGDFQRNAFSHEIVHVMQIDRGALIGHCNWEEQGITKALRAANGFFRPLKYITCAGLSVIPRLR